MRINMKRPLVLATIVVAAVGLSGLAAYAYWTTTGAGSATAGAGTNQAVVVTQIGTVPVGLAPDSTPQAVDFKITNSKGSPQYVTSVTLSIVDVRTGGSGGTIAVGCSAADFALVQPTAISADLPNGDTSFTAGTSKGATIQLVNTPLVNQDACKNVTVNLHFAAA
jgi:hypothetical protein